jgi:hypothetical protein
MKTRLVTYIALRVWGAGAEGRQVLPVVHQRGEGTRGLWCEFQSCRHRCSAGSAGRGSISHPRTRDVAGLGLAKRTAATSPSISANRAETSSVPTRVPWRFSFATYGSGNGGVMRHTSRSSSTGSALAKSLICSSAATAGRSWSAGIRTEIVSGETAMTWASVPGFPEPAVPLARFREAGWRGHG